MSLGESEGKRMQTYFNGIADFLTSQLSGDEVLTMGFNGEDSDFVRFNHSKVRQPGHVQQRHLELDLISGSRCTSTTWARRMARLASARWRSSSVPPLSPSLQMRCEPACYSARWLGRATAG